MPRKGKWLSDPTPTMRNDLINGNTGSPEKRINNFHQTVCKNHTWGRITTTATSAPTTNEIMCLNCGFIPKQICADCGIKYLTQSQKQEGGVATFNKGICCECGKEKSVTDIRNYNYLNK